MLQQLMMMMGASADDEGKINKIVDSFSTMPDQVNDLRARMTRLESKLDLLLDIKDAEG